MAKKSKTPRKAPTRSATALSPAKKTYIKSVAVAGAQIRCMDPDLQQLSVDELNVLHLCKHEIAAAIHRLYMHIDIETADPILRKYLQTAVDDSKPTSR